MLASITSLKTAKGLAIAPDIAFRLLTLVYNAAREGVVSVLECTIIFFYQRRFNMDVQTNRLNVYKGPDSMIKYFDPDIQPPLPLVELPETLNPFREDNVHIYAKMATALPAQNIKCLPGNEPLRLCYAYILTLRSLALNMLLSDPSAANKTIVEQSSGSTVTSLGMVARVLYNNKATCAYVSNKAGQNRIRQLRFFGLNVYVFTCRVSYKPYGRRRLLTHTVLPESSTEVRASPKSTILGVQSEKRTCSAKRMTIPQTLTIT